MKNVHIPPPRHLSFRGLLVASAAGVAITLSGCNESSNAIVSQQDVDAGKYHENSFSFEGKDSSNVAARIASKKSTLTREQLNAAVQKLSEKLKDRAYAKALARPLDYICDELLLATYNEYGSVYVGDSLLLDLDILKARCKYIGEKADVAARSAAVVMDWNLSSSAEDRQYPYKMIGSSWADWDVGVYKSTGGETYFKKYRRKYFTSAWYDLDADHIGVRIYLFDRIAIEGYKTYMVLERSTSDFYNGDYSVSKRDWAAGLTIGASYNTNTSSQFTGLSYNHIDVPTPRYVNDQLSAAANKTSGHWGETAVDFTSTFLSNVYEGLWNFYMNHGGTGAYVSIGAMPASATVAKGVISLHSVDHGNMKFRATSGSGLVGTNYEIVTTGWNSLNFVTW